MDTEILLRRAAPNDLKEVGEIEKVANSKTYSARTKEEELKNFIKNEFVFLIKKRDTTIGLISYEVRNDKTVEINGLVILPKFRGKGLSKIAMLLLLEKINKYSKIELLVHPDNIPALQLYLSCGFVIESKKDNYFGDGEPRLVLIKK